MSRSLQATILVDFTFLLKQISFVDICSFKTPYPTENKLYHSTPIVLLNYSQGASNYGHH